MVVNTLAFYEGDKRDCDAKWSMIALYQVATRNLLRVDRLPHSKMTHSAIWTNITPDLNARYEVPQDLRPEILPF